MDSPRVGNQNRAAVSIPLGGCVSVSLGWVHRSGDCLCLEIRSECDQMVPASSPEWLPQAWRPPQPRRIPYPPQEFTDWWAHRSEVIALRFHLPDDAASLHVLASLWIALESCLFAFLAHCWIGSGIFRWFAGFHWLAQISNSFQLQALRASSVLSPVCQLFPQYSS